MVSRSAGVMRVWGGLGVGVQRLGMGVVIGCAGLAIMFDGFVRVISLGFWRVLGHDADEWSC